MVHGRRAQWMHDPAAWVVGAILFVGAGAGYSSVAAYAPPVPASPAGVTASRASNADAVAASEAGEPGPTRLAVEIARVFGFPITNSMAVSWVVALGLIVFAQLATRRMELVPDGAPGRGHRHARLDSHRHGRGGRQDRRGEG